MLSKLVYFVLLSKIGFSSLKYFVTVKWKQYTICYSFEKNNVPWYFSYSKEKSNDYFDYSKPPIFDKNPQIDSEYFDNLCSPMYDEEISIFNKVDEEFSILNEIDKHNRIEWLEAIDTVFGQEKNFPQRSLIILVSSILQFSLNLLSHCNFK